MQEEQGVSSMAVISKVLGQKWSKLSPQEKEHYYNRAERDKQRYTSEMRAYFSHCYKGMQQLKGVITNLGPPPSPPTIILHTGDIQWTDCMMFDIRVEVLHV